MSFIKTIIELIAVPLAHIFNCSLKSGKFPEGFKSSIVSPIYKKGPIFEVSNYRPISLLNCISKILEKIVCYRLTLHLEENKLLIDQQFGFRAGRSTSDAVSNFLNDLDDSLSQKKHAIGLFCDLTRAFECVNPFILLNKLSTHYGLSSAAIKWFESYLLNRTQKTKIPTVQDGIKKFVMSGPQRVKLGVPQGSILGPLLFLVYVNDLIFCSPEEIARFTLFADDTSVLISGQNRSEVFKNLSTVIKYLQRWFTANDLHLNSNKTTFIYFDPCKVENIDTINSAGLSISPSAEVKFLGIVLDNRLAWRSHVDSLYSKLSSAIFAIMTIRKNVDPAPALLTYHSYFHSLLSYGIIYWGFSPSAHSIFLLQKRAVRSVFGLKRFISCRDLFKNNSILTFYGQLALDTCTLIHKIKDSLPKHNDIHGYNTRNKTNIMTSKAKLFNRSFLGTGITMYNKIPGDLKSLDLNHFKPALKAYLLEISPYSLLELSEAQRGRP